MIETKIGTKTWAEPGLKEADLTLEKNQAQLTEAQKKQLGADNLGSVLNKVSDPNWVDPTRKVRGTGNKEMDKDAFFKLMMAQLKNQDPTNPLKNHEMAAQLAQFSTLEQMSNVNSTLKEIKAGSKPVEQFQALNLIGKKVAGDSSKIIRADIDKEHEYAFKLPSDAKSTTISVMNNKGDKVREFSFNELKSGENKVVWNGETQDGRKAPAGEYIFQTESLGADGKKLQVRTDFEGVISGMSFSNEGPVIQIGKQTVRLKDIRQFSDPSLTINDQKSKDITQQDLKMTEPKGNTVNKEETKTEAQKKAMAGSTDDVLADVGMAGDLLEKLKADAVKTANASFKDKNPEATDDETMTPTPEGAASSAQGSPEEGVL